MLSLSLGHILRSEGHARPASIGMMFGGILNVILDPVLIFGFGLDVEGAAIATALSNLASVVFFIVIYIRLGERTSVSLHPKNFTFRFIRQIFSVGLASALATTLGNASNMVMVKLSSGYGDIPVAAYGIVKRIDQFPLNVSMGLCQGFMPLVGYNFASGNYKRMRKVSYFSWKTALIMFCNLCPSDPASVYSGGTDKYTGRHLPAYCLSGRAADFGKFSYQLYTSGNGKGNSVCHSYSEQTRAS
ncbi:MAG TPA: polysaccharide biosynthesis C-terminal domain-containing protein [Candidatus Scybalocola faecigallinarum]|uniref:Probable multidrug resistance protein NorM n=1 Tax=Candidatus Scybalocola faecigallinarum TaxID=2840941 RepID=A0A9D1F4I3_9FIRM|nr:polysaccharide biosynthesis C-terminal domain-containing protein [Candidatus Scybalocola faecigallinarum]